MEDFTQIFYEYKDRVYNQALRMLGSPQEAEEAAQDTFLRIYKGLSGFRGDAKLSSWIFRIAANVCISRWKQRKELASSMDDEYIEQEASKQHFIPAADVSLENAEFHERIRDSVARLQPEYSLVITLYYFEEMSYDEIARIAAIPVGTVGTYLHRARNELKSMLKRNDDGM